MRKQEHDAEMERSCDPDDEYDFKTAREYTWNIKTKKVGNEYDESYYFIVKDDGIYYNPLETRYSNRHPRLLFIYSCLILS